MVVVFVIAGTFLLCWLFDKGFMKLFRGEPQHMSGKSVRLNKFYGIGGLLMTVVGVAAIITGLSQNLLLSAGGGLLLVVGIFLAVYYLTFGVFYDEDSFVFSSFGKKGITYRYRDICAQQLYRNGAQLLIELHMADGKAVQLQSSMIGVYPFMDAAFAGWCSQKGVQPEACEFHDPDNSRWFPDVEG